MAGTTEQALRFAENLSLPTVQVVVMNADMGCNHCQQRVSKIVSKMNGLLDFMVDMRKKEVTVRGVVNSTKRKRHQAIPHHINKKKSPSFLGLFRMMCFCVPSKLFCSRSD